MGPHREPLRKVWGNKPTCADRPQWLVSPGEKLSVTFFPLSSPNLEKSGKGVIMELSKELTSHKALCVSCGEFKIVCCDTGCVEHENGSTEHQDPFCVTCCTNNHGPSKTWPQWERMDCDA